MRSNTMSLDEYDCKIQKVRRCRSAVSNETTLATRQEVFFTKVAPLQNINTYTNYFHVFGSIFVVYCLASFAKM